MASVAASTEACNTCTAQEGHVKHVSLAESMPYEMVEAILLHLSAPELLFAAANVPKLWRDVIETSKEVWRILTRHRYDNESDGQKTSATIQQELSVFNQDKRTIKCFFLKGILFAHRDSYGNAGLIFVSGLDNAPVKILDVTTSCLRYQKKGRTGCWYLQLFDMNGNLVCTQEVIDATKAILGRYFEAIVEDRENMERYLRGSRFIDQVPQTEDNDKPSKRGKCGRDQESREWNPGV